EARSDFGPGSGAEDDDLARYVRLVFRIPERQRCRDARRARQAAVGAEVRQRNATAVYGQAPFRIVRPGTALEAREAPGRSLDIDASVLGEPGLQKCHELAPGRVARQRGAFLIFDGVPLDRLFLGN